MLRRLRRPPTVDEANELRMIVLGVGPDLLRDGDPGDLGEYLAGLGSDGATAGIYRERLDLAFEGFDDDPRELFEITQVRRFCSTLDEQFPYWFFYMNKAGTGLQTLALCLTDARRTSDGQTIIPSDQLRSLIVRWITAMNEMCHLAGMSEADKLDLTRRSVSYLVDGPVDFPHT